MDFIDGELDSIQADVASVLLEKVTIERPTSTRDATGGTIVAWADRESDVSASFMSFRPAGPNEAPEAGQPTNITEWLVTLPYGTDITENDRIRRADDTRYQVGAVNQTPFSTRVGATRAD